VSPPDQFSLSPDSQGDVLAHRQPGQQRIVLEHHHLVRAGAAHRLAIHQHRAARGQIEAGDHVEQGRLAAAGMANQGDEFSLADLQINALEGEVIAAAGQGKILDNILNRNQSSHDRNQQRTRKISKT
jgi:hypothetical protein